MAEGRARFPVGRGRRGRMGQASAHIWDAVWVAGAVQRG